MQEKKIQFICWNSFNATGTKLLKGEKIGAVDWNEKSMLQMTVQTLILTINHHFSQRGIID